MDSPTASQSTHVSLTPSDLTSTTQFDDQKPPTVLSDASPCTRSLVASEQQMRLKKEESNIKTR